MVILFRLLSVILSWISASYGSLGKSRNSRKQPKKVGEKCRRLFSVVFGCFRLLSVAFSCFQLLLDCFD